jgi:CHAD domain-containing protein
MAKPLKIKKVAPDDVAQKAAARILRRRLKEFYSHWPDPQHSPTWVQLHDMRISGKRLRYSAELMRDFYPDRLALLIDLLKHSQDLLGEIQDCVTQRSMIDEYLKRLRRSNHQGDETNVIEDAILNYDQRRDLLFTQFREIWQGMTMKKFRGGLKAMIRKPPSDEPESAVAPIQLILPS